MPRSFEDLQEKMVAVKGLVPLVQIDVMDSTLTIDPTWPYLDKKTDPAAHLLFGCASGLTATGTSSGHE